MKLTGAAIIIETLIEQGTDIVFGYPGGSVLNLYDELYKSSDRLKHYITCHEQGAAHAADAYARVTGKTGVVMATSGPGATNLVTGIATAYLDSTPLIAITGNVATSLKGKDSFQEVDICGITMPITKHNYFVRNADKLADILREAYVIANSGRPGPVLIDVPKDVQSAVAEFTPRPRCTFSHEACLKSADIPAAVELIKSAKKPFIYAGGGVTISNASEELNEFAERIDAPIGTSMMGITSVRADNPRFLGMSGMHGKYAASKIMWESDLIIAVGTRFSDRATGNKKEFSNGKKILHIDIDPAEIGKNIPAYQSLIGDVKSVLNALNKVLPHVSRKEWSKYVADIKNCPDSHLEMEKDRLNPETIIKTVNRFAGENTVIATDVGQHQMWTVQYYNFMKPRTLVTSGGLGTMGFGMGAAIGSSIGSQGRTVLFTSDGSFHMNMNEMATAVTNNLPILIVVLDNNALGMVRQWQTLFYAGRYSNTTLNRKTDYVKLAEAFGMAGEKLDDFNKLEEVVARGFAHNGPYLIHAVISPDEKVLPMIPPGGTIGDIILKG
jgi:acetolactate synthase-1/2/3 large subunit